MKLKSCERVGRVFLSKLLYGTKLYGLVYDEYTGKENRISTDAPRLEKKVQIDRDYLYSYNSGREWGVFSW